MAVFTAFMETFTIASVPFYTHRDKWGMYTIGSVVYGIYFYVSVSLLLQFFFSCSFRAAYHVRVCARTCVRACCACACVFALQVSFPMFYRIMEDEGARTTLKKKAGDVAVVASGTWTASRAALDALAASMIVTIFLDLWRLVLGGLDGARAVTGLPWLRYT